MEIDGRSAIIVKPKQPYADWAVTLREPHERPVDLKTLRDECAVYLVQEIDSPDHLRAVLETEYSDIFREQLLSWSRDESDWPTVGDLNMFLAWFDVEFASLVFDLTA